MAGHLDPKLKFSGQSVVPGDVTQTGAAQMCRTIITIVCWQLNTIYFSVCVFQVSQALEQLLRPMSTSIRLGIVTTRASTR